MATEIGEYIVGAFLKFERGCGVVDYNARPPGSGPPKLWQRIRRSRIGFTRPSLALTTKRSGK